jgi:23S rRNA (cytosine1962-C5)-methyltransferase
VSRRGEWLAQGFYSPGSHIAVRVVSRDRKPLDFRLFQERLAQAVALRGKWIPADTDGYRVVNAEGDGLPGWTVDRYGSVLVSQITVRTAFCLRDDLHRALLELFPAFSLVQRVGGRFGEAEELESSVGVVSGSVPERVEFRENGLICEADPLAGQKTGWYCDQRENRRLVRQLAPGRRVLDLFAHTGGFSLNALQGGARRVTLVESSRRLLETARRLVERNGFEADRMEVCEKDVFEDLRERGDRYELIVCDPPPFARRRADLERASRAYKDVFRLALRRLEPGGYFLAFSCSGAVDRQRFRAILSAAASEAGVRVQLLRELGAGPDHPVDLAHPEGEYLKGALLVLLEENSRVRSASALAIEKEAASTSS